jgi:hypothetical protein
LGLFALCGTAFSEDEIELEETPPPAADSAFGKPTAPVEERRAIETKRYQAEIVKKARGGKIFLFQSKADSSPKVGRILLLKRENEPAMALRVLRSDQEKKRFAGKAIKFYGISAKTLKTGQLLNVLEKVVQAAAPPPTQADSAEVDTMLTSDPPPPADAPPADAPPADAPPPTEPPPPADAPPADVPPTEIPPPADAPPPADIPPPADVPPPTADAPPTSAIDPTDLPIAEPPPVPKPAPAPAPKAKTSSPPAAKTTPTPTPAPKTKTPPPPAAPPPPAPDAGAGPGAGELMPPPAPPSSPETTLPPSSQAPPPAPSSSTELALDELAASTGEAPPPPPDLARAPAASTAEAPPPPDDAPPPPPDVEIPSNPADTAELEAQVEEAPQLAEGELPADNGDTASDAESAGTDTSSFEESREETRLGQPIEEIYPLDSNSQGLTFSFGAFRNNGPPDSAGDPTGAAYFYGGGLRYALTIGTMLFAQSAAVQDTLALEPGVFFYKLVNFIGEDGDAYNLVPIIGTLRYTLNFGENFGLFFYGGLMYNYLLSASGEGQAFEDAKVGLASIFPAMGTGLIFRVGPNWDMRFDIGTDVAQLGLMLRF